MPTCSILISVLNASDYLGKCLKSILNQSFSDYRIIFINDASTDQTATIVSKWKSIFSESKFVYLENKKNIGLTKSLNEGLNLIDSEYTARIDADDWWNPDKLKKQIEFLENNKDYGIVGCNYKNIRNGKEKEMILLESDQQIKNKIIKSNPFAHSCVVFRTSLIKSLGGYDNSIRYGQDYDLWLRCLPHTKFYNLQEFLCYRNADPGKSKVNKIEQMKQGIKTRLKYIKKYNYPAHNYLYLFDPSANMIYHIIKKII